MTPVGSQSSPVSSPKVRIALVILVAAVLRMIFLGARSFWADEIVSVKLATDNWDGFWFWVSTREANMALYYLLLREWVRLGDSEAWVRLLSALIGLVTIPVLYALARQLYDDRTAWITALLAATNACFIEFSQEARSYSLVILLVVLSSYFFVRVVREGKVWDAVAYVLISICALYAHFFAGLVIVAHAISIFWRPAKQVPWAKLIVAWIVVGLGALPISFFVLKRDVGQLAWVHPTTFSEVYKLAIFFAGGSKAVAAVLSVLSLAAIVAAVAANRSDFRTRTETSWRFMLTLLWAVAPVALTILVSLSKPIFVHRYLLVTLPAYLTLIAIGLARLQETRALVAALIAFIALSSVSIAQGYFRPVEDWRGVVDYVLDRSQSGDALTVYVPYAMNNFNFYAAKRTATGLKLMASPTSIQEAQSINSPRFWVIIYPSPHTAAEAGSLEDLFRARYTSEERKRFRGIELLLYIQPKLPPSRLPAASAPRP